MMSEPQILNSVPCELREKLRKVYSIAVLAGAGISVASGINTFRGANQMKYFAGYPPAYLCSREVFQQMPELGWKFFHQLYNLINAAEPNTAHKTIAAWQCAAARRRVVKFYLSTTNFDGLLQRAGATSVQELHGNINRVVCWQCRQVRVMAEINFAHLPPQCSCGGWLAPDITLLNDFINEAAYDETITATRGCEIFFVIGNSGVLNHAASFIQMVKSRANAILIEINARPSYLSRHMHFVIRGPAEEMLPQFEYGVS